MLADRGDRPVGIVRNPDHVADLEAAGAEAVVLDLEQASVDELAAVVRGADAVVFAAGGGPNSGAARKETVDKGAAVLLADAAEKAGVRRYVMVSSMGTDRPTRPVTTSSRSTCGRRRPRTTTSPRATSTGRSCSRAG